MTAPARTLRFRGAVLAAMLLAVAGLAARNGALVLAAGIPLVYLGYGSLSSVSVPEGLRAEREVEPTPAPPGRPVRVTLTVTNDSDRTLSDVRVVDGVPERLAVSEGTPRAGTTLGPGESTTVEYVVVARRGSHEFDPPRVRLRDPSASAVATTTLDPAGESRLVCRLDTEAPPIEDAGDGFVGQLSTDRPGDGLAFHSTREHRPGDPADRLDWRGYAKRRTLSTVNYERQVAATVVLVVDAREASRVVAGPGRPTAVELSAYAATWTLTDLLRDGHDVAVALVGLDGPGPAGLHWLPPGSGPAQRSRALELFREATEAGTGGADGESTEGGEESIDADPIAVDVESQVTRIAELAPGGAQLALFSPLLDDEPRSAVETWRALGIPGIVLSPDVVPANTVSGQYESVRRRTRLARCQATGARTIDWRRGTPLPLVVEYAFTADARLRNGVVGRTGGAP